jgi:DNA-binding response OmpR family regulator
MESNPTLLIVEDDETLAKGLVHKLSTSGYNVLLASSAEDALSLIQESPPDLVLCDIMLGGQDGIWLMKKIKESSPATPVILLTAKMTEQDRVDGLEAGADDYVTKPFSSAELLARIRARLRDPSVERKTPSTFVFGEVEVDLRRRLLRKGGVESHLTTHEAGTLGHLITHRGRDVSREELLKEVWGYAAALTTRTVDNQILKLRKKIEDAPSQPRHILTVHGTGYRFEP